VGVRSVSDPMGRLGGMEPPRPQPGHTAATLERYAGLVEDSPHNLMSPTGLRELRTRHIPESVALANLLPAGPGRLLDVGSGGGLPGLVIAIMRRDLEVHLLDSTSKKAAFLAGAALELELPVQVHTGRAEELARGALAASFDVVTARAVAPLATLLAWTLPFLRPNGLLYAVKGERWRDELDDAQRTLQQLRGRVVATPDDLHPAERAPAETPETDPTPRVVILARTR
jgi:16S rRNA (guanine527-N7)-methyltransferase